MQWFEYNFYDEHLDISLQHKVSGVKNFTITLSEILEKKILFCLA